MISNELSTIQAKDAERASLAQAMAAFASSGGQVQVIPIIQYLPVGKHAWNRSDMELPGSSQAIRDLNAEDALVEKIRELAAKGAGITSIKQTLRIDDRRIKRLAEEHNIPIGKAYTKGVVFSEKARQSIVDAGRKRREKLVPKISALAHQGLTFAEIASAAGCSKAAAMKIVEEFGIQRGTRVALES